MKLAITLIYIMSVLFSNAVTNTIRSEHCTIQYNNNAEIEFVDSMGYIWFVDNNDLSEKPEGKSVVEVVYAVNNENTIFDDEIITVLYNNSVIFNGGWKNEK